MILNIFRKIHERNMMSLREEIESQMENYYYFEDDIYNTMTKDEIIELIKRTELISKTITDLDYYVDTIGLKKELESFSILTKDIIRSVAKDFNDGMKNKCLTCHIDMGRTNPRQLCGKWICYNNDLYT